MRFSIEFLRCIKVCLDVNVMRFANRILLSTNWSTEGRREGEKTELRSGEGAMPENGTLHNYKTYVCSEHARDCVAT